MNFGKTDQPWWGYLGDTMGCGPDGPNMSLMMVRIGVSTQVGELLKFSQTGVAKQGRGFQWCKTSLDIFGLRPFHPMGESNSSSPNGMTPVHRQNGNFSMAQIPWLWSWILGDGGFLKWGYPQIIHSNGIFHEINHHFWGTSIYGTPHIFSNNAMSMTLGSGYFGRRSDAQACGQQPGWWDWMFIAAIALGDGMKMGS